MVCTSCFFKEEERRRANVPIFFTRHQLLPTRFESSARLDMISRLGLDRISQTATKEDLDFVIKPKQSDWEVERTPDILSKR